MPRSTCLTALLAAGFASPGAAFAAHPLQTEDTGTQGAGNVEIENGLSWSRAGASKIFTYQPQVSYGASPTVDLILQPSWLSSRNDGKATVRGWGDTNLDFKWRFFGEAPLSFAVRAGLTLPTSQHGLGLPSGKVSSHALLATTFDALPFTLHANVGLVQSPAGSGQRTSAGVVSGAAMWAANERLIWTVDATASNADPTSSRWSGTVLAGAIYTVRPGLDLDVGYQRSARAPVPARQWLAGVTYRFAP